MLPPVDVAAVSAEEAAAIVVVVAQLCIFVYICKAWECLWFLNIYKTHQNKTPCNESCHSCCCCWCCCCIYAIEPSMPMPIVTSGQITAQVSSKCQFLAARSAKISEIINWMLATDSTFPSPPRHVFRSLACNNLHFSRDVRDVDFYWQLTAVY